MSDRGDWSPDEPLGTEAFEAWDEALDADDEADPEGRDRSEGERSLDRQLYVDEAEVDEAGVRLDDPERLAVLSGGIDDPDGLDAASSPIAPRLGDEGWDLAAEQDLGDDETTDLE
ncbi:MAG: hypothetical protein M3326_03575 [Actinomycetota bacterium]|nr:hypothetical protein [Actinomycetota bacterium]